MCVLQCVFTHIPRRASTPSVLPLSSDPQNKDFHSNMTGFFLHSEFAVLPFPKPDHVCNIKKPPYFKGVKSVTVDYYCRKGISWGRWKIEEIMDRGSRWLIKNITRIISKNEVT